MAINWNGCGETFTVLAGVGWFGLFHPANEAKEAGVFWWATPEKVFFSRLASYWRETD